MKKTLFLLLSSSVLLSAQQGPQRQGKPTWERVSQHDANKDGKVTQAEFKGPERAFTRFDANKDGSITEAEMKNLAPRGGGGGGGKGGGGKGGGRADNAPALGSAAPQLKALKLGSEQMVDLANFKKPTVLIFGSYT